LFSVPLVVNKDVQLTDGRTLSVGSIEWYVMADAGCAVAGWYWRHVANWSHRRDHVDDDVTAHALSQPSDDVIAARHDLDVDLVRVLVGARLARPDVLHAGTAVLFVHDANTTQNKVNEKSKRTFTTIVSLINKPVFLYAASLSCCWNDKHLSLATRFEFLFYFNFTVLRHWQWRRHTSFVWCVSTPCQENT